VEKLVSVLDLLAPKSLLLQQFGLEAEVGTGPLIR